MGTQGAFLVVLGIMIGFRLVELAVARRHERALRARGAREFGAGHYPFMVALHAAFLIGAPLEVVLLDRPFVPWVAALAALGLVLAGGLRWWAISSLGDRWTTRVLVPPAEPRVRRGPYRFFDHPNYLAVIVEIVALPMLHGAWVTALLGSAANAWMMVVRVSTEAAALSEDGS